MFRYNISVIFSFMVLLASPVFGQAILEYETGAATASGLTPTLESGVTGNNLISGGGLTVSAGSNFNWRGWDPANSDYGDAITALDFWTWGFTVSPTTSTLILTDFGINVDRSGSGPDDFEIRASVNAGAEISLLTHSFNDSDSTEEFSNISLASLPSLFEGDEVTFKLAAFTELGDPPSSSLGTLSLPNGSGVNASLITVTGEFVAVPEPASTSLLAIGLLGFGLVRLRNI